MTINGDKYTRWVMCECGEKALYEKQNTYSERSIWRCRNCGDYFICVDDRYYIYVDDWWNDVI